MEAGRSNSLSELARFGFEELSSTVPKVDRLVSLLGDLGRSCLYPISKSASPDRALDSLISLAEIAGDLVAKILKHEASAIRLTAVLGASDGLAEFLMRHPRFLDTFLQETNLPDSSDITAAFSQAVTDDLEEYRQQLRVHYRALLLKIADWDLAHQDVREPIKAATQSLSDLAAATLQESLRIAYSEVTQEAKFPESEILGTKLAVIAMGKCGARELNYLSDVDVIFVVSGDGENLIEIGTRLATRMMRNIDQPGIEPGLWQVDANLRPEGKSGALVRTIEGHLSYYQRWAENWEFQALLKARPVAGDLELGEQYVNTITPLIWSRGERSGLVETSRRMRQRVLENIPLADRDFEIKLGRGGLRDIEFTVQLLQLVHGAAYPSVRVADTLSALDALCEEGLLGRSDRDSFASDYKFLRALEHRVQLSKLRRDHLLPKNDSDRRRVARSLSGLTLSELDRLWADITLRVAELHDAVFYKPLLNAMAALDPSEVRLSDEQVSLRLEALGFQNPGGAIAHLAALTQGVSRRATIQKTLLPVLLRWLGEGVNPDRGLLAFRRLSEELGETPWFLRMLRDSSGAAERLMRVLSSSEFIAKLLEHIPESSQWFTDPENLQPQAWQQLESEFESLLARTEDIEPTAESVRSIRRREILRIGIGAVLGELSISEVAKGLTELTDLYLLTMLEIARKSTATAEHDLEFAIVTMGRLGGGEIGFGSDADAMFVYRSSSPDSQAKAEKLASALMNLVKDQLLGFELDLDLRPEGKQGVRVRSLESYSAYYQRWADTWEFQALLRARPIGSESLCKDFEELIEPYRYPAQLEPEKLTEIRRIKARVETERLPQGADPKRHLKLGRGSLSDVEWLVQVFQMRFAHKFPELQVLGTMDALANLERTGLISDDDAKKLADAWLLSSRIRSGLVLANDRSNDSIPTDRLQLEAVARILEYQPGGATDLEQDYLSATRKSRAVFENLFVK